MYQNHYSSRSQKSSSLKIWIISAIIAILGLSASYLLIQVILPSQVVLFGPTPVIVVIPAPTATQTMDPSLLPTPTTLGISGQTAGGLMPGMYVQISGTGVEGLRIHLSPSLDSKVLFFGSDSEVFLITKGPENADGHVWWYLSAPYDQARSGWAVMDYLTSVATPNP